MMTIFAVSAISLFICVLLFALMNFLTNQLKLMNSSIMFECGVEASQQIRKPMSLHFFLIGLIFIMFDIEIIFLFNMLSKFNPMSMITSLSFLMIFILFMFLTLILEWKMQNIKWEL